MSKQPAHSPARIRQVIPYAPITHQPYVHDLVGVLSAPIQAWSRPDGSMRHHGAEGIYVGDTRAVSGLVCRAPDAELSPLPAQTRSARTVVLRDVVTQDDSVVDPVVTLERERTAIRGGFSETIRLRSDDSRDRSLALELRITPDASTLSEVKEPRLLRRRTGERPAPTIITSDGTNGVEAFWEPVDGVRITLRSMGACTLDLDRGELILRISLEVPGDSPEASFTWELEALDTRALFTGPEKPWDVPGILAALVDRDGPLDPERRAALTLLERSLSDLDALRMVSAEDRRHTFLAAGAPWFLTLFGRDSVIAASLLAPIDSEIARGTLRVLAALQGTVVDPGTAEAPGKILHERRAVGIDMIESYLPPVYYGTIDATPLWIDLLHTVWRTGDEELLAELRGALERTATWLLDHADADGDGLLEYIDESGHGLANQGWKDSGDSIRFADGSLAEGTIALSEVQGYAYQAALQAAEMLEHLGEAGDLPQRLRDWAARLHEAFHRSYWCEDEQGPFIALALDGRKTPVDGVASNMGHLLGTGLLDADQERIVVDRLLDPTMFSGYGVRTLSTTDGGFGPLRYHGGSVWTHDTGWILRRMLLAGFETEAAVLARGLLRAAQGFDWRLPELFSGQSADEVDPPMPYPASCRPQAWAAASAIPIAQALGVLSR